MFQRCPNTDTNIVYIGVYLVLTYVEGLLSTVYFFKAISVGQYIVELSQ